MKASYFDVFAKVMGGCHHLVIGDPGSCEECEEKAVAAVVAAVRADMTTTQPGAPERCRRCGKIPATQLLIGRGICAICAAKEEGVIP